MEPGTLDLLPKRAQPAPLDDDIPYIRCGVCRALARKLYAEAEAIVAKHGPKKVRKTRLESDSNLGGSEGDVETLLLHVCNPEKTPGKWMRELDVYKNGSALLFKQMPIGRCRRECRTIEKVCYQLLEDTGDDDLGEILLLGVKSSTGLAAFSEHMCKKMTKACKKGQPPPWPEGKVRKNEEFIPLTKNEIADEEATEQAQQVKTKSGNPIKSYKLQDFDIDGFRGKADPRDELKDEL